jgi:Tannase and feruloyl esterase
MTRAPRVAPWATRLAAGLAAMAVAGASTASAGAAPVPPASAAAGAAAAQASAGGPPIRPVLACADLVQSGPPGRPGVPDFQAIPGAPTRVASAAVVAATTTAPAYCHVQGYVAGQVHFDLKLPTDRYQGRYLQFGCGGFCGVLTPPAFPGCDAQLGGDFAVAATDDGHTAAGLFDALWAATDEQLHIDFGHRAVHVTAVAAKAIVTAFYGTAPHRSYFSGCSDGGREGLMEAQRYPRDFDGILAGAPANLMAFLGPEATGWVARVNTDAAGHPIVTAAKIPALHAAVLAACDAVDGLADGQLDDPRACRFDPATLACPAGADRPDCLTPAQVHAARLLYSPPTDPHGRLLYPGGLEPGSEASWAGPLPWVTAPPGVPAFGAVAADNYLRYLAFAAGRPGIPLSRWEFTARAFDRLRPESRVIDASSADLRAFRAAGGKLILYHGWADTLIPPRGTLAYYQAVQDRMGGPAAAGRFARLFMFPDVFHCTGGGPSPDTDDLLLQLVRWRERGQAPERTIATQTDAAGRITRTRPVFAYPTRAGYDGTGSIDDAANFVPAAPATRPDDHIRWLGNDLFR